MAVDAAKIRSLLTPTIEDLGYELWGCIIVPQGRYSILRIYIDSEKGITVDDCERVSRQVSVILDVEDPISGAYTLEVSSPGIDRPLFTLKQFERYIGEKVNIRMHVAVENKRHVKGILKSVTKDEIEILIGEDVFKLTFDNIARANLIPEDKLKGKSKK